MTNAQIKAEMKQQEMLGNDLYFYLNGQEYKVTVLVEN